MLKLPWGWKMEMEISEGLMRLSPSDPKALFQLAVSSYSQSEGKELLQSREKHILLGQDSPRVLIKSPGCGK